jgi:hypothetical protein
MVPYNGGSIGVSNYLLFVVMFEVMNTRKSLVCLLWFSISFFLLNDKLTKDLIGLIRARPILSTATVR